MPLVRTPAHTCAAWPWYTCLPATAHTAGLTLDPSCHSCKQDAELQLAGPGSTGGAHNMAASSRWGRQPPCLVGIALLQRAGRSATASSYAQIVLCTPLCCFPASLLCRDAHLLPSGFEFATSLTNWTYNKPPRPAPPEPDAIQGTAQCALQFSLPYTRRDGIPHPTTHPPIVCNVARCSIGVATLPPDKFATFLVAGWSALASLAAGATAACATSAANSDHAYCWRETFAAAAGRLMNLSEPTSVESSFAWRDVSIGNYLNSSTGTRDSFACGIGSDGSGSCWGSDFSGLGLLGAGGLLSSSTPLPLAQSGPWISISAGHGFSCGVKFEDSSAWCWWV